MNGEAQPGSDARAARSPRRTIMPAYYKMSQDLGPLPKRFAARRVRFLMVAILVAIALVVVHHFWR